MRSLSTIILSIFLVFSVASSPGCANFGKKLKAFLGGEKKQKKKKKPRLTQSYKKNPNHLPQVKRQYKRVTKETLANENNLSSDAGSLWVMEGQGSFLFSQNIIRMIGDPLAVKIDGDPEEQLKSKATVISKLIAKLEERRARQRQQQLARTRGPNAARANKKSNEKQSKDQQKANTDSAPKIANEDGDFKVKRVPTRVVERMTDGNYRVKGSQPFMIGSREYKVIVAGVVRAEDFSSEGISASKLIDPRFDIIAAKRGRE